jgi:hypothetical protein
MKKIIILIFLTLFLKFTSAEVYGYFNAQKTKGGFLIGVEVIDKNTKKVLDYKNFVFGWNFPLFKLIEEKTFFTNIFYLDAKNKDVNVLNPTILRILDNNFNENYKIQNKPKIITPSVKIVKKINDLIFPISAQIQDENITFSVITKNFSSNELIYYWTLDNVFISRKKEININELPKKNGILEVRVTSQNEESASDSLFLKYD